MVTMIPTMKMVMKKVSLLKNDEPVPKNTSAAAATAILQADHRNI